jgi:hypothetical protein
MREGVRSVRSLVSALTAASMLTGGLVITTQGAAAAASSSSASTCAASATLSQAEQDSTTGITSTSVTTGNVSVISGPVPGLFQGASYGVDAYYNYINTTKHGVNGRTLVNKSYDDGFSGTQNQSETAQIAGDQFAEVGSFSIFDNYGCNVLAQDPSLPDVSVSLDPGTNALPNSFSVQPLAQGAPLTGYQLIKKKYPSAIAHVGNLVANLPTALANWQGQQAAMEHLGYKFSYVREISPLESNFTADVVNMKNDGTKLVYLTDATWQVYAALVKEMAQQNFHPILISAGPIYDPSFVTAAGGAQNVNGTWLIQGQALYLGQDAKTVPAVSTFLTWMRKTHPGFNPDLYSLFGWSSAQLFVQALQAAGKSPTRGKVLAALAQTTSFSASNLLAPSNPAKKIPPNCVLFAQIKRGSFTRVPPTAKSGWDCSGVYYSIDGPLPKVSP